MTDRFTAGPTTHGPSTQGPQTHAGQPRPRAEIRPAAPMNTTELLLAFGTCACLLMSALLSLSA